MKQNGRDVGKDDGDDDLRDLLRQAGKNASDDQEGGSQMAPLNLEQLSGGDLDVPVRRRQAGRPSRTALLCMYCAYACDYAPRLCCLFACTGIVVPLYFIVQALVNPTVEFGVVQEDFTDYNFITSKYDDTIGKIHHWCIRGDDESCRCEDPLQPQPKLEFRPWVQAEKDNKNTVREAVASGIDVDVAFLGESVTEEMGGKWLGRVFAKPDGGSGPNQYELLFQKNFDKSHGAKIQGIPLGVAGDTNPSVLWRLRNGILDTAFNPKIWWLQLGMNDIGRMQCSEEVVVLGVLRVVEEIMNARPDAKIVVNSLLPMAGFRGGAVPTAIDYRESFGKPVRKSPRSHSGERHRDRIGALGGGRRAQLALTNTAPARSYSHERVDGNFVDGSNRRLGLLGRHRGRDRGKHVKTDRHGNIIIKADEHKMKKYEPGIVRHERQLPLWTSITAINVELEKFCKKHDNIYYFDATQIFAEEDKNNDIWLLRQSKITFRGRPTFDGYRDWETKIIAHIEQIL